MASQAILQNSTPSIPEDVRHTCPSSVPAGTGPALQCPWCKFTFSEDKCERLTFSEDQKQSDEQWKRTRDKKKDKRVTTNDQPTLAAACSQHREFLSKSQDWACSDRDYNDCIRCFIKFGHEIAGRSWPRVSYEACIPAASANNIATPMKGVTGPVHGNHTSTNPASNNTKKFHS